MKTQAADQRAKDDQEVLSAYRAFEETELLNVRPFFWRENEKPRRVRSAAHTDWVAFLCEHEVLPADPWRSRLRKPVRDEPERHIREVGARSCAGGRYVDEFAYRLNEGNVRVHTMDRIDALIGKTLGVRLTYANLTGEFA